MTPLPDRTGAQIQAIRDGAPFAYSRWSDGEWSCLLGRSGHNQAGMPYSAPLRKDLTAVLLSRPDYDLGLSEAVIHPTRPKRLTLAVEVPAWLAEHGLDDLPWVDADGFYRRSLAGTLGPFVAALATRQVVLVGPSYFDDLRLFPVVEHVLVPPRMRHEREIARLTRQTLAALRDWPGSVVAISAGMSANVLIDRVHAAMPEATLIDCGSLWEPYIGRSVRRYHAAVLARERVSPTLQRGAA
jgi:hypothetical protein